MVTKGIKVMFIVFGVGILFNFLYPKIPVLKNSIHAVLDPSAGLLLNFNVTFGLIIITAIVSLILSLVQKYTTNQTELKKIRAEQKLLQEEMKQYKDHPEKLMELQKKQLEFIPKTMDLTMAPLLYTTIPILLFFRWFYDYFALHPVKIFGVLHWLLAYIILSILFSTIFRKMFKMA